MPIYLVMLYALIEVLVFLGLWSWLGFGWSLLVWLACTIGGMLLATRQMQALAPRLRDMPAENPGGVVATAALTAAGAVLLALPGIAPTVVGGILTWAPTQKLIRQWGSKALTSKLEAWGVTSFTTVDHFRDAAAHRRAGDHGPTVIDIDPEPGDTSPSDVDTIQQWPRQVEKKDDYGPEEDTQK